MPDEIEITCPVCSVTAYCKLLPIANKPRAYWVTCTCGYIREWLDDAQVTDDIINHPKHYNSLPANCICGREIECIDITRHMGFALGNVVKYVWRSEHKNGIEDLKKARWYLDDVIKQKEKQK